jgi:hypothetical protein
MEKRIKKFCLLCKAFQYIGKLFYLLLVYEGLSCLRCLIKRIEVLFFLGVKYVIVIFFLF